MSTSFNYISNDGLASVYITTSGKYYIVHTSIKHDHRAIAYTSPIKALNAFHGIRRLLRTPVRSIYPTVGGRA